LKLCVFRSIFVVRNRDMIRVNNITKTFAEREIFSNVSFSIPDAKIYALVADNGVGKTTLLRTIANIYNADSGNVVSSAKVSYLPEERGLPLEQKVFDFLLFVAQLRGMRKKIAKTRITDLLKKYSLFEFADFYIGNLSKGMQQKIQFLSVIIDNPKVLILDEPFSGIDEKNKELFWEELLELKNNGASILISAHKTDDLTHFCDAFLLFDGKSIEMVDSLQLQVEQK